MPKMKHLLRKLHIGGGCNNGSHHPSPPQTAEVTPPLSSSSASLESALMRIRAVESAENLVDFNFFEEEFQVQLALAISVSDPDSREDPETVQIKDTKQISLGFLDRLVSTLEEKKHHQVKLKEGLKDLSAKRMELQNSLTSLWPKQVFLLHPPISVSEGDDLNINFPMDRSKENHRLMKVELSYEIKKSAGTLLPPFRNKFYIEISSTSRFSDEFLVNLSPAVKSPATDDDDLLQPVSDHRISDGNKKEVPSPSQQQQQKKSRGENVIHLIPLFLLLCALILWWFSVPLNKM